MAKRKPAYTLTLGRKTYELTELQAEGLTRGYFNFRTRGLFVANVNKDGRTGKKKAYFQGGRRGGNTARVLRPLRDMGLLESDYWTARLTNQGEKVAQELFSMMETWENRTFANLLAQHQAEERAEKKAHQANAALIRRGFAGLKLGGKPINKQIFGTVNGSRGYLYIALYESDLADLARQILDLKEEAK